LTEELHLDLKSGRVTISLRPDLAPNHVARVKELANAGFYDGVAFHRVIPGFMAQTGDPTGTGTGGSTKPDLKAEFSPERHVRGTCSMARTNNPDSGNSQFFICFADAPWLDKQYTVWGRVISGMEHVDAIKKGHSNSGAVSGEPDRIVRMRACLTNTNGHIS
jgi:peptidylprolyl isomerase